MQLLARLQLQESWGEQCTALRAAVELDGTGRTALVPESGRSDGRLQCRTQRTVVQVVQFAAHGNAVGEGGYSDTTFS